MSPSKSKKTSSDKVARKRKDRATEIANTFEWLITAFILAFVFRAFVMEAFRIPTGSMADTLKGAHFRLRCGQCGYKYDHGFDSRAYGLPEDTIPPGNVELPRTRCPSCGYYPPIGGEMPIVNGDRILVLKCIYQFIEPKRWDVVVFKNPLNPSENYIKRLIGLPGEKIEIIDGDIYINGKISRKPPKVQNELWMPVYDNDYQPVQPGKSLFNGHTWQQPFKNIGESKWRLDTDGPTVFGLDSPAGQINTMVYDTSVGNDLKVTYAYGDVREYRIRPYCSDLMVRFYAHSTHSQGCIGIALSKYQTHYKAWIDWKNSAFEMVITKTSKGQEPVELARRLIAASGINQPTLVKFANVDHGLILEFGGEKLIYDLGHGTDAAGPRTTRSQPSVEIFGSGKLTLSHVAILRDIHYTSKDPQTGAPFEFKLGKDEFFMLGDNSPNSKDSRWWEQKGIGINGQPLYREGTVPRDYLVGKAMFVYWPSGFGLPWPRRLKTFLLSKSHRNLPMRIMYGIVSLRWIPNVGQMRFIYGGSNKQTYLVNRESYLKTDR